MVTHASTLYAYNQIFQRKRGKYGHLSHAGGRLLQRVVVEAVVHEHGHQVAVLRIHDVAPQLPRAHLRRFRLRFGLGSSRVIPHGQGWPQCCISAATQHCIMQRSGAMGWKRTLGFWPLMYAAAICTCGRAHRSHQTIHRVCI